MVISEFTPTYYLNRSLVVRKTGAGVIGTNVVQQATVRGTIGCCSIFYPSQVLRQHIPFGAVWTQFNSAVADQIYGGIVYGYYAGLSRQISEFESRYSRHLSRSIEDSSSNPIKRTSVALGT